MSDSSIEGLRYELSNVHRLLESMAQLLRDSQLAQAGADRVTAHTREQLLTLIGELTEWTDKADREMEALSRRTRVLEDDHEVHTSRLAELIAAARLSADRMEKLLGIQMSPDAFPLKRDICEILRGVRELTGRDATGEPLTWTGVLGRRIQDAFWVSLGTACMLWAVRAVTPLLK